MCEKRMPLHGRGKGEKRGGVGFLNIGPCFFPSNSQTPIERRDLKRKESKGNDWKENVLRRLEWKCSGFKVRRRSERDVKETTWRGRGWI